MRAAKAASQTVAKMEKKGAQEASGSATKAAGGVGQAADKTTKEVKIRKSNGADGATSRHIIERNASGETISVTHKVTKNGKVVHQHQNYIGKEGGVRQFPDEWTGTKTINAPYTNIPPKFPPDKVKGGRSR